MIRFLPAMLASIAVASCGGGGGSGGSTPTAAIHINISGNAAVGPIRSAEVLAFKAGDYSSSVDDAKALNAATPAATDPSTGHYSVDIGNYSGPVVMVVRPKTTGSTMCDVLSGNCNLPFNFRMRAVLPSVFEKTIAHITPFTEMAAKAVGTSADPATIDIANWAVRMKVLSGPALDPLTTSPVVDSTVPATEQSAQKQMVVALAAVAKAATDATNAIGSACATGKDDAAKIACAVDAMSNTVSHIVASTANTAKIDGGKVAGLSGAMTALATIKVPTLDAQGNLTTSTTLDTTTDSDASQLKTLVSTNSAELTAAADPVTGLTTVNAPPTTVLSGVGKAKAFFSDLRTNVQLFSNSANTGLLNLQGTRIKTDMTNNIAPDVNKGINRLHHLIKGAEMFSNGSVAGATISGGSYPGHFQCTVSTTTTVTCLSTSNYAPVGSVQNYLQVVLTKTVTANSPTYQATAMTCTSDGNYGCSDVPVARTDKATGSGSMSYTTDAAGKLTSLTVNGTFPGSNTGEIQDKVTGLNGVVTTANAGLSTATQKLTIAGSIASYGGTPAAVSATPMVTVAFGSGSYATDELDPANLTCTANCNYQLTLVHVVLVASTAATSFTGTLDMSNFMYDSSGTQWAPTNAAFSGSITDVSAGGSGQFMTGSLALSDTNYASFNATQPKSSTNFVKRTATFTGNITFPAAQAQPVKLVLSASDTGYTTGTMSVALTYGSGKSIGVSSASGDSTLTNNSVTLTNQDGLMVTLIQGQSAPVKVGSVTVATVSNNMVNYSDGYVESLY